MNYPLHLSFKTIAIAQQITITDAQGNVVFFVKQKAFKLKEAVTVFADVAQTRPVYTIQADRILDFNSRYSFKDAATGEDLGGIKRQGMKSLWKTHYDVQEGENTILSIHEENAWIKVADAVVGEIPIIGMFTGYLLNPAYLLTRPEGAVLLRLKKQPAFFEGKFTLEKVGEGMNNVNSKEEIRVLLALIMMLLLERSKG